MSPFLVKGMHNYFLVEFEKWNKVLGHRSGIHENNVWLHGILLWLQILEFFRLSFPNKWNTGTLWLGSQIQFWLPGVVSGHFSPPPPPSLAPLSLLEKDKTQFHFALLPFSEQLNSTQTTTGNNHLQKITGSNLWMRNLYHEKFAYFRKRKNKLSTCDLITGQYWWGMVNLGLQNSFS